VSLAQVGDLQAVVLAHRTLPGHADMVAAGQPVAVPLHSRCVSVEPLQLAATHAVPAEIGWQAPEPLQLSPVQVALLRVQSFFGSVPEATGLQLPSEPVMLQAWQAGQDAVPQHTPSTQVRPPEHCALVVQVCPRPALATHAPP
jgi:hypothetical protein